MSATPAEALEILRAEGARLRELVLMLKGDDWTAALTQLVDTIEEIPEDDLAVLLLCACMALLQIVDDIEPLAAPR